jgi:hypothetical protein
MVGTKSFAKPQLTGLEGEAGAPLLEKGASIQEKEPQITTDNTDIFNFDPRFQCKSVARLLRAGHAPS